MNEAELKSRVIAIIQSIAPEVEGDMLRPDQALRRQVDLDSMDWLGFLVGLHRRLGVDIPETDYAKLVTLDDLLEYLAARVR